MIPLSANNSNSTNWNTVNNTLRRLENEQVTKAFKQAGGYSVVNGKLPFTNGYGTLIYDSDNVPRILIGTDPNGDIGVFITIEGVSVIEELT